MNFKEECLQLKEELATYTQRDRPPLGCVNVIPEPLLMFYQFSYILRGISKIKRQYKSILYKFQLLSFPCEEAILPRDPYSCCDWLT